MSAPIYLITICLPLLTVLIIFAMRYASAVLQARARLANDDAYRQLAQKAAAAEDHNAAALTAIQASLEDVRQRFGAIETLLKTVE